ncbi:Rubrerythrin domain-containing protein [Gammaproteobacteria bacterium]
MSQIDEHLVELVRSAIGLELNGEYFYRRAAEATAHPKGKAMFLQLAEHEQGHIGEIGALFASLIGDSEWERITAEEIANPRMSPVISQLEAAVRARGHTEVADDTQALRLAMELERRAVTFFEGLENSTKDLIQQEMIRKLADEERYHYDFLQAQLDSVLNVGIWLDAPEFRLDGKF